MIPIGGWALREAVEQAKKWHDAGHPDLTIAVNLSVTQLQQTDLVHRVREILAETQLPPQLLELEITESSAMINPDRKSTRLNSSHLVISYAVFCLKKKIK